MQHWKRVVVLLSPFLLAACGNEGASSPTQSPPVTLAAPPSITLAGNCDNAKDLENWLQTTSLLAINFQAQMNAAVPKAKAELYQDIVDLGGMRNAAFAAPTPNCAIDAQLTLSDAMSRVVTALQAYFNGDQPEIGNAVTEANSQLDEVIGFQADMLDQLTAMFQQQQLATPTT